MPLDRPGTLLRLHHAVERRLNPRYVRSVCCLLLAAGLIVLTVTFATQERGKTIFGPYLGADFAVFYVAGTIFNSYGPDRIYDVDLHTRLYQGLFPDVPPESQLPYANAPFFVLPFALLAHLPYQWACLAWMVIFAGLYYGGLRLLLGVLNSIPQDARSTVLLLAFSFTPFLIEGVAGGQTSAFGFFWLALALRLERQGRPLPSGAALALCAYKPTLLVLILPMLVLTRRLKTLAGFAIGASGLALISLLAVGQQGCRSYLDMLLLFLHASTKAAAGLKTWKYVDINSFARLLAGEYPFLRWMIVLAAAGFMLGVLIKGWAKAGRTLEKGGDTIWSLTIVWTLVLNVYLGIYDTLLVVPAVLVATDVLLRRRTEDQSPGLTPGYKYFLLCLFLTPWITQPVARVTGVQLYTLVLAAFGWYLSELPARQPDH